MEKLKCDICGGSIMVQPGGQVAVCESCGVRYSIGRMREKVQEITGTVRVEGAVQARQTGTEDDVSQWRSLLDKYYSAGDFQAAENIVKKILEAVPADEQANKMYDELQVLKFVEIKNGVLVKYTGLSETLTIPGCVEKIADGAFQRCRTLKYVHIPTSVTQIGSYAFCDSGLESIKIPDSVIHIGAQAFNDCRHLESVIIPDRFDNYQNISSIFAEDYSSYCPWYNRYQQDMRDRAEKHQRERRKQEGLCQHCGGEFTGIFTLKCARCRKPKDY